MSRRLPDTGPEREIFLRALRNYSEACHPPALTPGCPFAIDISSGKRGCGEECVSLLAKYDAPRPVEEIVVGEFSLIRSRRPRSRRGPEGARPFDARETALEDEDKRPSARRTAALLFSLRKDLCEPPDQADPTRRERITEALDELARRGFDVELLIRFGFGQQIATAIVLGVVMGPLLRSLEKSDEAPFPDLPSTPAPWAEILLARNRGDTAPDDITAFARLLAELTSESHPIFTWASSATVDDLIEWAAPPAMPEPSLPGAFMDAAPHRWIVDRFLTTYYDDWETSSLHFEWQYLHGEILPPCPVESFSVRRTTAEEIAGIIAERATKGAQKKASTPLSRYVFAAVDLLRSGNRDTAASLFEVVIRFEPTNAEAHNNLGFCLLPDRPSDALYHFERASELGWGRNPFSLGNRIYALAKLGRLTSALELAEDFFNTFGPSFAVYGWMWSFDDEAKLLDVEDAGHYVRGLVFAITERAADPSLSAKWAARFR